MIKYDDIRAILTDLDGTLINSEKAFYLAYKKVLYENYKVLINSKVYKKCELDKNATLLDTLRIKNKVLCDVTNEEIMKKVFDSYTDKFKKIITNKKVIDRFELLKKLKNKNYKLVLVTTCNRYYLNILMKQLNLYNIFDFIVAREDVKKLKPANDAYLLAMKKIGVLPNECLVLEDSKRGIKAAYDANIRNIIKIEEYTSVKFNDNRCVSYFSSSDVFKDILKNNR